MSVYQWLCVVGVPSIIALIWTTVLKKMFDKAQLQAEENRRRSEAIENGIREIIRIQILDTYDACVHNDRRISVSRKDAISRSYTAYHALGGNDTITRVYAELMDMDLV